MATHDYDIANQSGANFRTDLNNALDAIVSNNSNASDPSTTFAYMWWVDTSNNVLKFRNSANNAWITLPMSITASNTITPTLNMGTGAEEDVKIVFDGNAKDFYIALDDSADKLVIGEGSTVGTNSILTITDDSVTIGDGTEVDTKIVFDGNAQDFYIGLDDSADDLIIGKGSTVGTTPAIVIDENQKVGIGDTPDLAALHVKTADSGASADSGADELVLENSGDTGMTILSGTTSSGSIRFGDSDDNDNGLIIYNHGSTPFMRFFTGGSERMRLTGANVGIGTTSPDAILETSSSATGNTVGALLTNTNQSGTADSVSLNFGLGRTTDAFIFSVPAIKLEKEQQFTSDGNTVDAGLIFSTLVNESTVQRMEINSAGQYGFNSTYPPTSAQFMRIEEELSTNRVMRMSNRDNSGGGTTLDIGHCDNNEGAHIILGYHGNNVSGASGDPFLDPVFSLQVNGNLGIDGTLSQGSDRRLKKDIANSTYGLATINQLIPRTYKHRDVSKEMIGTQLGFIADEVESIIPEVVSKFGLQADGTTLPKTITGYGDESGTEETFDNVKTLDYERLVVVLTKALQEADDKIDALTARVTTLEG